MRNRAVLLGVTCILGIAGCPTQPPAPSFDTGSDDATAGSDAHVDDGGMDAGRDGATPTPDSGIDGGNDAGSDAYVSPIDANVDAYHPPITTSDPAPPADIVRTGTSGLLLRGTVLTPTGVLSPGEVLVTGNTIRCVAADCSATAGASTATIIDTHATISPGLIDAHNHLTYDFIPPWVPSPPQLFHNRYEWRGNAQYSAWVNPEGDSNHDGTQDTGAQCPGAKWGELRSIVHGTTTVQGQAPASACLDRLARNAEGANGLGVDVARTTISGACESGFPTRPSLIGSFTAASNPTTRFYVHMGEGYANAGSATRTDPLREFGCYDGTDATYYNGAPCTGHADMASCVADTANECAWSGTSCATTGMSLLENALHMPYGTAVFIHAMPLTGAQLDRTLDRHAHIVWSPSSNMVLYGQTADIAGILSRGIPVGLGPDWSVSGAREMLSEMRFAQQYGVTHGVDALTAQQLWRMATVQGADVVGLSPIGTLAVGQRADISVFGRTSTDPYQAVIDSRARDVRLVLIDGVGYYGDAALQATTAVNTFCESFDACGTSKYLCAANTPGSTGSTSRSAETVADVHAQLVTIMASYSRTDVLELVDCTL